MRDHISIARIATLHPKWRPDAQAFIEDAESSLNLTIRVVQALRTFAEQDALYAQGRTKPGPIVTYSPAGTSYHCYGLAMDSVPFLPNGNDLNWNFNFELFRPFAEKYGIQMGIDFPKKDSDHVENKYGYNWRYLRHKHEIKDFIINTTYVNI